MFFFNDSATTEIYTLSLHDALPISGRVVLPGLGRRGFDEAAPVLEHFGRVAVDLEPGQRLAERAAVHERAARARRERSEEHTSELQSRQYLVCRLLLEKKKNTS